MTTWVNSWESTTCVDAWECTIIRNKTVACQVQQQVCGRQNNNNNNKTTKIYKKTKKRLS